jgi:sec-independent protein translocase protein TatA
MPNIGPLELVLILLVVLLLFGAKRLPELGRSLGSGMREFKDSVTGKDESPASRDRAEIDRGEAPRPPQASARAETPVEAEPRH